MAATKRTTRRAPASTTAAEESSAADVLAILAEFGDDNTDAMIHLSRAQNDGVGATLRFGYLETFQASAIPEGRFLQLVRDQYGGGRYQVKVTADGQPARFRNFSIDDQFTKPRADSNGDEGANAELIETVRELRAELRAKNEGGGTSLKEVFEMAAVMNSNTTEAIKVALDMAKPRESEPMSEILATLRELRSFEAEGRPKETPTPGYLGIFERIGVPLLEKLEKMSHTNTATPEDITTVAKPLANPVQSGDWLTHLEAYLPAIVNAADLPDSDPVVYAEMLYDQVRLGGDKAIETLEGVLQQEGYRSAFSQRFPQIAATPARAQWFTEFMDALEQRTFGVVDVCGILGCTLDLGHDGEHDSTASNSDGGSNDEQQTDTKETAET